MSYGADNIAVSDSAAVALVDGARIIDVGFNKKPSEGTSEKTMHGNRVYDILEEKVEREIPADPQVYEAAQALSEGRLFYRGAKRAFDVGFSAIVLVLFSWLYAFVALAIKLEDPKGPVFFKQERIGKNGQPFNMLKFRSMKVNAEDELEQLMALNEKTGPVFKITRDPRVTKVGKVIRRLSLDELPQFINVLCSDMSIVGPRPALRRETSLYTERQEQRLLVKPGITCYWQTRFDRDKITFDEWVDLDLLYIKQCGIGADFKQVVKTVLVVLTAQGN